MSIKNYCQKTVYVPLVRHRESIAFFFAIQTYSILLQIY